MGENKAIRELRRTVNGDPAASFKVSGIAMQYAAICKRELWFYLRGVEIDTDNVHIVRGTHVDESSYDWLETESRIIDGMIAPDFLNDGTIVEVKPSSKLDKGARRQLLYYLWYFEEFRGQTCEGVLAVPSERERETVDLDADARELVKETIETVYTMKNRETPPPLEKKPYCDSCAYQDMCWVSANEE